MITYGPVLSNEQVLGNYKRYGLEASITLTGQTIKRSDLLEEMKSSTELGRKHLNVMHEVYAPRPELSKRVFNPQSSLTHDFTSFLEFVLQQEMSEEGRDRFRRFSWYVTDSSIIKPKEFQNEWLSQLTAFYRFDDTTKTLEAMQNRPARLTGLFLLS